MKNIVLTGFMGSGKTAVSAELARLTGFSRVEVDDEIERQAGMSISDIFERFGEERFRDMEAEQIRKLAGRGGTIISTGGGAVMREENMAVLRENGVLVYLRAEPRTLLRRTSGNSDRPLLNCPDPLARISELLELRKARYEMADIIVDTDEMVPGAVAGEILKRLRWKR